MTSKFLRLDKGTETGIMATIHSMLWSRGGWTAPCKASWETHGRFLIHARTVAKRTSLWHKEIWKLSKDKSVRLQYFKKIAQYIFIVAIRIMTRLLQTVGEKNLHYTEHRDSYLKTGRP